MRRKERKSKVIVAFLIAFGIFINLSSNFNTNISEPSKSDISIRNDETIDGKH